MKKASVSILILNYNGKGLLKILLDSVKKQAFKDKTEIVVVDNNSTDGSEEFLRKNYPYVKFVKNSENLGTSGINSGLSRCNGKYIFYLNNDIELEKNCLQLLYDALERNKSSGLAVPTYINFYNRKIKSGGFWMSRSFYGGHYLADGSNESKEFIEMPYAGVFLFRKEIINRLGYLFDPDYFIYSEDVDFSLRARLLGYKTILVPKAVLYHVHMATIGRQKGYKPTYFLERNLLSTFFKVLSLKSIIILLPYVFGMRLLAVARDISRFQFMSALMRVKAILWVFLHFNIIYKKRLEVQKIRKVNDKELLRLFTEKYIFKSKPLPL